MKHVRYWTWEREGTQTRPSGDRCRQCDVWVSGGCDAVMSRVTCHEAVTQLVTGLQTPDRDLHRRHQSQSAAAANNQKMTRAMVGGGKRHDMENGDSFTFHWLLFNFAAQLMCPCPHVLQTVLSTGDTEPFLAFSLIHVSVMSLATCCSAADTRTSHCRLQTRIKTR